MADSPAALADALRDRYLLERELGRGGMATVHLARDLKHDRPVALKVLHPALAHALGSERFQREIRFAARLQHPHILSVHDSGESGYGLARAFRWLFMKREEAQAAASATELLERRTGYAFDWTWGASDAEARYDAAANAAAAGHLDQAIEQLEQGIAGGWRDTALLDHDSEFQRHRSEPALRELRARVDAIPRVPVPPEIAGLAGRLGDQEAPRRSG